MCTVNLAQRMRWSRTATGQNQSPRLRTARDGATASRVSTSARFRPVPRLPFTAEQVIRSDGQMMWQATVRQAGIPIRGFDRLVGGEGAMQWKVLGIVPVMTASGPDITRSTVGRLEAESVWLPSALCAGGVTWTASDSSHLTARMTLIGHAAPLELTIACRNGPARGCPSDTVGESR